MFPLKKTLLITTFSLSLSISLPGCGGGGGSSTTNTPVVTPPNLIDYSCDPVTALVATQKTAAFVNQHELYPDTQLPVLTYERWILTVDGEPNELNVAILRPHQGTPILGVNMTNHGQSDDQATKPFSQGVNLYWMNQVARRGYISVAVARRGNFGSTGKMYYTQTDSQKLSDYYMNLMKYQAASVMAVMDKMANDPAYKPYMSTVLLDGTSGGSDTVMQVAADSTTFRAATKKAIIRFAGGILSPEQVTPGSISSLNQYGGAIGKSGVPSLWIIGDNDQTSAPGPTACQFKFFNQSTLAAGYANTLYTVPGMGHTSTTELFSPALRQIFREYMASRGFDGFN